MGLWEKIEEQKNKIQAVAPFMGSGGSALGKNGVNTCNSVDICRYLLPKKGVAERYQGGSSDISLKKKPLADTKTEPGHEWVCEHLDQLKTVGFTDNDLFSEKLPRGIVLMRIFAKSNLNVEIESGLLVFTWKNIHGDMIRQTCRPETKTAFPRRK